MRIAGAALLVLVFGTSGAQAQPVEVAPPPRPAKADAKLEAHLAAWTREAATRTNYRLDVEMKRTNAAGVPVNRTFRGSILGMKPDLMRLRLEDTANPKDYEEFIVTSENVFAYSGLQKTVTELKRSDWLAKAVTDNMLMDLFAGVKLQDIQERFAVRLFKDDDYYVYLDLWPLGNKEKQEVQQLRVALYGPKTKFAYLPAQVYVLKPNGDTEQWTLSKPRLNLPDIDAKHFQYEELPGFKLQKSGGK